MKEGNFFHKIENKNIILIHGKEFIIEMKEGNFFTNKKTKKYHFLIKKNLLLN